MYRRIMNGLLRAPLRPRVRQHFRRTRRQQFETLEARYALDSTVVFNELMYHPLGDESTEYLELYNQMAVDMDISGWQLTDGVRFDFPDGTIIPGDGYVVVARDPNALATATEAQVLGPYEGRLSNGGERVELRNNSGRVMNVVDYDDNGLWPQAADGLGVSLAKRTLNAGSDEATSWTSSVLVGGTPGRANFAETFKPRPEPVERALVTQATPWRYDDSGSAQRPTWTQATFDDTAWQGGDAPGIYYAGDAKLATALPEWIPNVTATASSMLASHPPSSLVDRSGLTETGHVTGPSVGTMWVSVGSLFAAVPDMDPEVTFDLGSVIRPHSMKIWNLNHLDTATCCLNRGAALIDIYIAGEDQQFELWQDDFELPIAPGDESDFGVEVEFGGQSLQYVKFDIDTTNGVANHGAPFDFVGLSEVEFRRIPPPGDTQLSVGPTTHYFRTTFPFDDAPERTTLSGNLVVDDGAVVYLNGQEIYRHNMAPGIVSPDTLAASEVVDASWQLNIPFPSEALVRGDNILAVETHQADPIDSDMTFAMELSAVTTPPAADEPFESLPLQLHEVTSASDASLSIEIRNTSSAPVDLQGTELRFDSGFRLRLDGDAVVDPNALFVVSVDRSRANYADGDLLALVDAANDHILDGIRLRDRNQSRVDYAIQAWQTGIDTIGATNQAPTEDAIVINEIMYNHRPINVDADGNSLPYTEVDDEWIELYNRTDRQVDLSGWSFASGVEYQFPAGTMLDPHSYLVISNDADAMRGKYADVASTIIGSFAGGLRNQTELIQLVDAFGNVADEVRYYENGQWPQAADGRGSSIELQDPHADNALGGAWAASDESERSTWRTYTYRGPAGRSRVGPDTQWSEFVMGMLSDGEVLVDDISLVEDPDGTARQLIQNGSFEGDALTGEANAWRLIGNHRQSRVIADPDNPGNNVLHFVAAGATEHMHNHAETTLKAGEEFVDIGRNTEYEVSFRAKWLTGSNLLHTRLYFNRLPRTTRIAQPELSGTPGRVNSTAIDNLGPLYDDLRHSPTIPGPNEPILVQVYASDADSVGSMSLWYSVDEGAWQQLAMSESTRDSVYSTTLPGQPAESVIQFYVEGQDSRGATTSFPANGRDSRALIQVHDDRAIANGLHNFRMIMTASDTELLHDTVELMSNQAVGTTVVYDESEVFYDVGIRLSGSQRARPFRPRLSFQVKFPSDQLFRGVHSSITLDRSESTGYGQRELLYHHGMSHAGGGLPSEYNDLFHIITPRNEHTGAAEAQLARYSDIFLDEQYENGSDGQLYEFEYIYYPTTTDDGTPEGRKRPQPDTVATWSMRSLGPDPEEYRWIFLNKNNRHQDDYSRLIEVVEAMGTTGSSFNDRIDEFVDTDQWLRAFAFSAITGHGDNYGGDGAGHNAQFFIRPSDNRAVFLPHDLDAFFQVNRPIIGSGDLRKFLRVPHNEHMYYGHVYDLLQTTFNSDYMTYWAEHFGSLLPGQRFDRHLRDLQRRTDYLLGRIDSAVPPTEFAITDSVSGVDSVRVSGTGWIDVRSMQIADTGQVIDVEWTDATSWVADIPATLIRDGQELAAIDFQGEVAARAAIPDGPLLGDINGDEELDVNDLDALCVLLLSNRSTFDLNGDAVTNHDDHRFLAESILNSGAGDANLDGVFGSDDIVQVFLADTYNRPDRIASWATGDWDCSGIFDSADLVYALSTNEYNVGAAAMAVTTHGVTTDRLQLASGIVSIHGDTAARRERPAAARASVSLWKAPDADQEEELDATATDSLFSAWTESTYGNSSSDWAHEDAKPTDLLAEDKI